MPTKPKRPRDTNQLAKLITAIATGDTDDVKTDDGKNPAAVALGRKGGLKGGKARAQSLTAKERSAIAKKAAKKRWAVVNEQREAAASPKVPKRKVLSVDPD
jgi:hypothetical protein